MGAPWPLLGPLHVRHRGELPTCSREHVREASVVSPRRKRFRRWKLQERRCNARRPREASVATTERAELRGASLERQQTGRLCKHAALRSALQSLQTLGALDSGSSKTPRFLLFGGRRLREHGTARQASTRVLHHHLTTGKKAQNKLCELQHFPRAWEVWEPEESA